MDEVLGRYANRQAQIDELLKELKPLQREQRKDAKEIKEHMHQQNLDQMQAGQYRITREQKYRFSCNEELVREQFEDCDNFIEENTKESWQFKTKAV